MRLVQPEDLQPDDMTVLFYQPATMADWRTVERIRKTAERNPKLRATGQWQYDRATWEEWRDKRIAQIEAGTMQLVRTRYGTPVAIFCVDNTLDEDFWTPEQEAESLTLHGTVVATWAENYGVGSSILDVASVMAFADGRRWLRFEVWKKGLDLQAYYRSQGFTQLDTIDLPHRGSGARFERLAGIVRNEGPALVQGEPARSTRTQFSLV